MRVTPYPWLPGTDVPARLEDYAALFRPDFPRRDQARWLATYLRGLLRASQRKNIPTIAESAAEPPDRRIADPTQALQNFINQSPWDEQKLLRRLRAMVERRAGRSGVVVVLDVAFPKQGSQSVGVQRQYSREFGRKINCQIAVALFHIASTNSAPVGLRLYLPRRWVQTPERLAVCGVPSERCVSATRTHIALELLDDLRDTHLAAAGVIPGPGYDDSEEFQAGLAARGLRVINTSVRAHGLRAAEAVCARMKTDLGLDHFEGRSWRGFHHHAALTMLAYAYLTIEEQDWIADGAGI
jgi:SRSO17 transposase